MEHHKFPSSPHICSPPRCPTAAWLGWGSGTPDPKPWWDTAAQRVSLVLIQRYPTLSLQFVTCVLVLSSSRRLGFLGTILLPPHLQPCKQGWPAAWFSLTGTKNSWLLWQSAALLGPPVLGRANPSEQTPPALKFHSHAEIPPLFLSLFQAQIRDSRFQGREEGHIPTRLFVIGIS